MISIRRYIYVTLLGVATLSCAPNLASAQEATHGKFTLMHEVHFGNATIPAGEYDFSYDPSGVAPVLLLNKISGRRAGFMVLVPAVAESKASDESKIVVERMPEGRYVTAMQLPESGITLHFKVLSRVAEKQIAKAENMASTGQ